ncbi:MAG: hypothetical protein PHV05_03060 [Candidatus Riflebacteria bacterium]|nr:hypothetical protein [Candidatus Riflebacteria bacterium]
MGTLEQLSCSDALTSSVKNEIKAILKEFNYIKSLLLPYSEKIDSSSLPDLSVIRGILYSFKSIYSKALSLLNLESPLIEHWQFDDPSLSYFFLKSIFTNTQLSNDKILELLKTAVTIKLLEESQSEKIKALLSYSPFATKENKHTDYCEKPINYAFFNIYSELEALETRLGNIFWENKKYVLSNSYKLHKKKTFRELTVVIGSLLIIGLIMTTLPDVMFGLVFILFFIAIALIQGFKSVLVPSLFFVFPLAILALVFCREINLENSLSVFGVCTKVFIFFDILLHFFRVVMSFFEVLSDANKISTQP